MQLRLVPSLAGRSLSNSHFRRVNPSVHDLAAPARGAAQARGRLPSTNLTGQCEQELITIR
jgi:hypothetical protein